jgi:CrcB protein
MLTAGFCGGYTTFSTFSYETARLVEDGDYRRAALYVVLSVLLSLAGTFVGFALARQLLALREGA